MQQPVQTPCGNMCMKDSYPELIGYGDLGDPSGASELLSHGPHNEYVRTRAGRQGSMYAPPPPCIPPPTPGPPGPLLPAVLHNRRKREGGRTMENDPSQCFFTGAENRIRAGTGAPLPRRKEQHHILYGNEHVTMTLLTANKRQQHHTSVVHTAPHRRGGANQKDHRPYSTGGEGTRPNKTRRGKQQGQTRQLPT